MWLNQNRCSMKYAIILALLLGLCGGCNGNTGVRAAYLTSSPAPGNPQQFDVYIWNNTQWPLALGPLFTGQPTLIVAPGTAVMIPVGYLPAQVSVFAQTYSTPVYTYPTQTQILGRDYGANDTSISFGFP